jgi:ribosomal protein L40E
LIDCRLIKRASGDILERFAHSRLSSPSPLLVCAAAKVASTECRWNHVKVCPHCAEELPDEATVCSNCHKDPALTPAWATPRRPEEPPSWSSEDLWQPGRDPRQSVGVPGAYEGLEPEVARKGLGIPAKVSASLILAFAWRTIGGYFSVLLPGVAGVIFLPVGYLVGLILGNMGRAEVKPSDRLGLLLAYAAIGLNAVGLFGSVPSLAFRLAR